jgi:hypothetical protein
MGCVGECKWPTGHKFIIAQTTVPELYGLWYPNTVWPLVGTFDEVVVMLSEALKWVNLKWVRI